MPRDMAPFADFRKNPIPSHEEAAQLRQEIEEKLRRKAVSIEKNLDNSMANGNKLKINKMVFFTKRLDEEGPEPLIAESLMTKIYGDAMTANKDINDSLDFMISKADNEREEKIFKKVKSLVPNKEEKGYKNMVDDGAHGWYYSGSNAVVMKRVPEKFFNDIKVPPVLRPLKKLSSYSDEQSINATIAHELTHAWLNENSSNYGSNDLPGALNEIFSYYVSYVVRGGKFSNAESDLYDRPDLIKWGVQLLVEKAEEFESRGMKKTGIDFSRKLQLQIYNKSVTGNKSTYKVFLKACLLKEDKRRLQRFRKLDEEIKANLGGIKHLLFGDVQGALKNTEEGEKLRQLAEQISWEDPSTMEDKILDNILHEAVEEGKYGDLEWVNHEITRELEERRKMLAKYLKGFEIARNNLSQSEFRSDVEQAEKKIINLKEELEEIIDEGNKIEKLGRPRQS